MHKRKHFAHLRKETVQMNKEKLGCPSDEQLAKINRFSRKKLEKDEVYVFPLTLCDNDVDRDNECFSEQALNKMAELFIGKTGILDHSMKTRDQCARTFDCYVERDVTKKTKTGDDYLALKAFAYIPRGACFENIITQIESGIKKEVSVSCLAEKRICSVCGADQYVNPCGHIKGKTYKQGNTKTKCHIILDNISDAYEWSFVAVPAQTQAGVTKSLKGAVTFEHDEQKLTSYIESLKKAAHAGEIYKGVLMENAIKYSLISNPALKEQTIAKIVKAMDLDTLIEFEKECKKSAGEVVPLTPQLYVAKDVQNQTDTDKNYLI